MQFKGHVFTTHRNRLLCEENRVVAEGTIWKLTK